MPLPLFPVIAGSAFLAGVGRLIFAGVLWALGSFFGKLVVGLGIGTVTYVGLEDLVESATSQAINYLSLPSEVQQFAGVLMLDKCFTIWASALTVKMTMMVLTKVVLNKGN